MESFYIDTSIWIDLLEERKGYSGENLGSFALQLFARIKAKGLALCLSDILLHELARFYTIEEIRGMTMPFEKITKKILSTSDQRREARRIAIERNVPLGDALHAILARDHRLIFVTRDNDFRKLQDICPSYRPEDLI